MVLALPQRTHQALELAVSGDGISPAELTAHGWCLRDPLAVSRTLDTYRRYIQRSRGEFSVAKHGYIASHSGWFSDRSAAYLASGRPVVLQDTGYSTWLPTGLGLVAYRDLDEAVEALARVNADYEHHSRAARAIAEEYFDARRVQEDAATVMKVLMLCGEIPYPPYGGSRMRVYQFIRALAARHQITLLAYQHADDECGSVEALSKLCQVVVVRWQEPEALRRMRESGTLAARLAYGRALLLDHDPFVAQYFRRPAYKIQLLDLLTHDRFDLVHVEDTAMMTLLPEELSLPVVLSIQNVETWRESRAGMAELGQRIEFAKLRRYERNAFARAAVCCPTSGIEAEQIKRLLPGAQCVSFPMVSIRMSLRHPRLTRPTVQPSYLPAL